LARIDAAAIETERASPWTIERWGMTHQRHGVGQYEIGLRAETLKRADHRPARGLVNVQRIDLGGRHGNDLEGNSGAANLRVQVGSFFGGEFLGIVQARNGSGGIENDRGSDERAEQRAAPGLVAARHQATASTKGLRLKAPRASELAGRESARHRLNAADCTSLWLGLPESDRVAVRVGQPGVMVLGFRFLFAYQLSVARSQGGRTFSALPWKRAITEWTTRDALRVASHR
jgi:hypothetical protein